MKTIFITMLLITLTFGLIGCSQTTARHENARLDVQPVSDEYQINRSYDETIDINWPY